MAQWINLNLEQQICDGTLISYIVRKKWPYIFPPLVGLIVGRLAERIQVDFKIFKFPTCETI